jgi:AAA domain
MKFLDGNKGSTIMRATENLVFEPLIDTLVERTAVGMIVAPAKAKKSMLALNLVFSLLTKKPFLGLAVSSKPDKIIYINLELTKTALGVRMRAMNQHYQATPKQLDNVIFLTAHEFSNDQPLVDTKSQEVNPEPFKNLAEEAKTWGATVIIIDPLYYVVGEENDNVLMTAVIREFGKLRDQLNATVFVVHHTGKGHKDWSDPFLAGRGASSLAGAFEFVLGIEPKPDNEARLHHGSRNYASIDPFSIRFDPSTLTWRASNEATADGIVDKIMSTADSMPLIEFYKVANLSRAKANQLIACCKTYQHVKAKGKQKAMITRKF